MTRVLQLVTIESQTLFQGFNFTSLGTLKTILNGEKTADMWNKSSDLKMSTTAVLSRGPKVLWKNVGTLFPSKIVKTSLKNL